MTYPFGGIYFGQGGGSSPTGDAYVTPAVISGTITIPKPTMLIPPGVTISATTIRGSISIPVPGVFGGFPLIPPDDGTGDIHRYNLMTDPSFEYGSPPKGAIPAGANPPTLTSDATAYDTGIASLKAVWNGIDAWHSAISFAPFPTTPGKTYVIHYRQKANPRNTTVVAIIAGMYFLSHAPGTFDPNTNNLDGQWHDSVWLFTATATSHTLYLWPVSPCLGLTTNIDSILVEDYETYKLAPADSKFFDGEFNGGRWLGIPGSSYSEQTIARPKPYTEDEAIKQFQQNGNTLRFQYERLDKSNNSKGYLKNVITGGKIDYDYNATIKRSGSINMLDVPNNIFDYLNDRIRPWVGVQMPDQSWYDFPLGVFLPSAPDRMYTGGLTTRACQIFDQTQSLIDYVPSQAGVDGGYSIKAGTLYTDAITSLLLESGISNPNVVPSLLALPTDRTWSKNAPQIQNVTETKNKVFWAMGASAISIINDLLQAINYDSIWFDGYGIAQCLPYTDPANDSISHTYMTNNKSIIFPNVDQNIDLFSVPNVIVYVVSQPDRPILTSKFINDDPNSIVSTVNRGRRIVKFDSSLDVATQSELDALAQRAGTTAANVYEQISMSTLPMPNHRNRDAVLFVHDGLGIDAKYSEQTWSLTLSPGAEMTHTMRRIVNVNAYAAIAGGGATNGN